jgi:hypothetical protein
MVFPNFFCFHLIMTAVQFSPEYSLQVELYGAKDGAKDGATASTPEFADVLVHGTFDRLVDTIEQLGWLATILVLPTPEKLTIAGVDFRVLDSIPEEDLVQTELILQPPVLEQPRSAEPGKCWMPLFDGLVITRGFKVANTSRKDGRGLEIPYEIMAFLPLFGFLWSIRVDLY